MKNKNQKRCNVCKKILANNNKLGFCGRCYGKSDTRRKYMKLYNQAKGILLKNHKREFNKILQELYNE